MSLFFSTIKYRLKTLLTTPRGIVFFVLAFIVALSPFIGLIIPDAPIPIGWIDEDNTEYSQLLKKNVKSLNVVWITEDDEDTLIANLQNGRLEGVFVIKEGFEKSIKKGVFEDTLKLLRSPYSTAAGVISESVGGEALRLWLTSYSAKEAGELGGEDLYDAVFRHVDAGTDEPILTLMRQNAAADTSEVTPLLDAAYSSLFLLAALCCFYMLTGLSAAGSNHDFAARLKARGFSLERYKFAIILADRVFILPCVAVPLIAFGIAGAGDKILPIFVMFTLYLLSFGGIASLISKINNRTVLMLCISVITIANVMFGSLLISLPSGGVFSYFTYLLPSRWLSSIQSLNPLLGIAGLCACALFYNLLPFLFKKKEL